MKRNVDKDLAVAEVLQMHGQYEFNIFQAQQALSEIKCFLFTPVVKARGGRQRTLFLVEENPQYK